MLLLCCDVAWLCYCVFALMCCFFVRLIVSLCWCFEASLLCCGAVVLLLVFVVEM